PVDLTAVAGEIGTTADDAAQRMLRLRRAGVVRECVAKIEPAAVGVGCTAFLLVRVAQNADNLAAIRQLLSDLEAVEEAHAVSGDFDWLLKVRAATLAELQDLVTGKLSLVPGFIRAQTCIVLETACDFVNADRVRLAGH
ncbi:MAG TPA: Lrp/AsnC family transcriptional regulator, partial [Actinoplanes sp.]|nr:Lrp/AsnC family transcriptional regulator [Actinoplanes sp.]